MLNGQKHLRKLIIIFICFHWPRSDIVCIVFTNNVSLEFLQMRQKKTHIFALNFIFIHFIVFSFKPITIIISYFSSLIKFFNILHYYFYYYIQLWFFFNVYSIKTRNQNILQRHAS